jgi:hypothetical protein
MSETIAPKSTTYMRTLQRAADTFGSVQRLAAFLRVSHADVLRWIAGEGYPPHEVFLAALDIVATGTRPEHLRQA